MGQRSKREVSADVVIAGAGGAGLTAAGVIAALAPSLRVVILEKDSRAVCSSAIASNFIPAAGTRFQQAAGIVDTPETLAEDIRRKNRNRSDPDLTLAICKHSAAALHCMVDRLGVELELAPELAWLGHSVTRMHAHPSRGGPAVVSQLLDNARRQNHVEIMDKARAMSLRRDAAGHVVGIDAVADGDDVYIRARKSVLTTGGYNANPTMRAEFIPAMADAPNIGAVTDTGDGILAARDLGAKLALMSAYQGRDCIDETGTRITPPVINEGGIAVNVTGRRFVDELTDYSALAQVYRAQPGQHAWFIWDQRIQDMVRDVFIMQQAWRRGGIVRSDNIQGVAQAWNLPGTELERTLKRYNDGVRVGRDEFARARLVEPLTPPLYSARITGAVAHTQGGLAVDTRCRVLREDGTIISNLYAGGNTIAGLSGDEPGGYLSGNGLLVAYTSGYLIGRDVVRSLASE